MDSWRCTQEASLVCHALIHCEAIDWSSYESDMIKRAYWACVCTEALFHQNLDMPQSSIGELQERMQLPTFSSANGDVGRRSDDISIEVPYQEHFLAMISLTRLTARVDEAQHECGFS